jgi:hypothetical protein
MLTRLLHLIRQNVIALIALFVALGGTSYAALNLPANSVGTRQLKNRAVNAAKLNPSSVAASIRAWADLTWANGWHVQASSNDIHVTSVAVGADVSWRHTRFPSNCMASVTPKRNFGPGGAAGSGSLDGYVSTFFNPRGGNLQIDGIATSGIHQSQSVVVLIVCPSVGSQKAKR